jgi:hypothetical protein
MIVLHVNGVMSGRQYDVPVNYIQVETGESRRLLVTSQRDRTWWRNVRDRIEIGLTFKGQRMRAMVQVEESEDGVAAGFMRYFQVSPGSARFYSIDLTSDGKVRELDLARLASERVVVWVDPI